MALHQAKERYIRFCAVVLKPQWLSAFLSQSPSGNNEYNVQQMGRRAFKKYVSFYVVHSGDAAAAANHAWEQFSKADNMTDKMGALSALNHVDCLIDKIRSMLSIKNLSKNHWL